MIAARQRGRLVAGLLALLAAGCQPLPHPFADDKPPASLVKVPDSAGVSIAPIVGQPAATAAKLGAAVAAALLKHDIPASDRTTSLRSYLLYGRVVESRPSVHPHAATKHAAEKAKPAKHKLAKGKPTKHKPAKRKPAKADTIRRNPKKGEAIQRERPEGEATVTALWRLYDPNGRVVGERTAHVAARAADWASGNDRPINELAQLSADALASLLQDSTPVEAPAAARHDDRVRVAVEKITGAPGDGATSLAAAVAAVLQRQDLAIVKSGDKADLYVAGKITLTPVKPDKQHIKIVWQVRRADGVQIGTVGQENDIPRGLLDGPWGDVAYSIAIAASDGLMQLVARGAPQPKS